MTTSSKGRTAQSGDWHCVGCHETTCEKHGEANTRGDHVHVPDTLWGETWKVPLSKGFTRKSFWYPRCGGKQGCGAVFMNDAWYVKEPAA